MRVAHVRRRRRPARAAEGRGPRRLKPFLIGLSVATFCSALLLHGLVHAEVGVDARGASADGDDTHVPSAVVEGGPVLDTSGGQTHALAPADRTVALSFDDGPDATWTPRILAVLARHRVPGTFFVVGANVAREPDIARAIRAQGSEIGLHTFTHVDLGAVSPARVDRELTETQVALAGATGELSYLVRPPYSSEPGALDDVHYGVVERLGGQGYVTALVDVDAMDWARPGPEAIARNAAPEDGRGGVVLLHDAGGDRSQTVEALDRLIPELQARGYRFTTVSGAVGLPPANFAAGPVDRATGASLLAAVGLAGGLVEFLRWSLLVVGGAVVLRCLVMALAALRHARRRRSAPAAPPVTMPATVVVPAYNERECIAHTLRSLLASTHPIEILVVDDGSTDGTADLVAALDLPGVRLLRQDNAGKATALNTGIAAASHELVVLMDGDTVFEPGTVAALVAPFADPEVGAVSGNARVADRNRLLARLQHIEYVVGFNIDRRVQDAWGVVTTVPGAVGAFRASALRQVGGISSDTLAEDTDLAIALGRAGWRITFEPGARAWTEAPATLGQLWRQRYRWSYGIMQSLWKHRHAAVERGRSGHVGRLGLGLTALYQVLFPLLAPLVDVYLVYGLFFLAPIATLVTWSGVLALQLLLGVVAFRLEGEPLRGLWLLPAQQLVYRQLMYAVLIQSVAAALSGIALGWQKLPRLGTFSAVPTTPAALDAVPAVDVREPTTVRRPAEARS